MPSSDKKSMENIIESLQIRELSKKDKPEAAYVPKGGLVSRVGGQNIVTVEISKEHVVQQFEAGRLHDSKGIRYSTVAKGFTDDVVKHNQRFRLNELTRGPLSVEAEEEARIEVEVQRRLGQRLDELRNQVTADAYQAGFASGKEDGKRESIELAQPQLEQFEKLVRGLDGLGQEIFKANEEILIHMVYQLTKAVVLKELSEDIDYTRRLAVHLLERLGTRENIKIFVGEAALSSVDALKQGLVQSLGQLNNVSVEADASIKDAGCRVETEFGEVDGRIEVQLQNIAAGLSVGV